MYKLMVVSRCIKDAKERTREILDAYGLRIGQKTWNVKISETGKRVLISKLKEAASKNSSIAIYKYGENNPIEIIGSKKYFNNGQTSIETESEQELEEDEENIHHQIYKRIISLAAYFHDIGKSEKNFQEYITMTKEEREKNKNVEDEEILKHEIVSFYILRKFKHKREGLIKKVPLKFEMDKKDIIKENENINLEKIIRFLVAFHHKLGEQKIETFGKGVDLKNIKAILYDSYNAKHGKKKTEIQLTLNQEEIDKEYEFYKKEMDEIEFLLEKYNIKIDKKLFEYFFHYGRMSIMIADHHCSKLAKDNEDESIPKTNAYSKSPGQGKQKLQIHMKEVGDLSKQVYEKLIFKNANGINQKEIEHIYEFPECNNEQCQKYIWQKHGFEFMDKHHDRKNGLFCIISSSTGSGKTKFGAAVTSKMSENIRLTVALGLRNLTLQVGDSYREMTKLDQDKVKTQIGDHVTKLVFDNNKKDEIEKEVDELENEEIDVNMDYKSQQKIEDFLKTNLNTPSKQSYYNTPIVISTIDYIMGATNYRSTSFIVPSLRVLTTDLLLDEVDGYDLEQFYSMIRLVYMTGVYGNKLYLSTATLIPSLIESLFAAYKEGYEIYANANKKEPKIDSFIISDFKENNEYLNFHSDESFNFIMNEFLNSDLKTEIVQYKVDIKDIDLQGDDFNGLFQEVITLSSNNNETYKDGKKCSVGMIRVAYIKNGFKILKSFLKHAENLMEANKNLKINIVFYHSQMFSGVRSYLEKQMDLALNRKGDKKLRDSVLFEKDIKSYDTVINIFIVTPVEEVGRDHDFDWAIIEPSSMRSIIQTAGRVNRHRMIDYNNKENPNMILLNKNFEFYENYKTVKYSHPGFETEQDLISNGRERDMFHIAANSKFDNVDVIKTKSIMSTKENKIIGKYLSKYLNVFNNILSLVSNNAYKLNDVLEKDNRKRPKKKEENNFYSFSIFRQEEKKRFVVYKMDSNKIKEVNFQLKDKENQRIETEMEDINNIYEFENKIAKYNFNFINDSLEKYLENLKKIRENLGISYEYQEYEDIFLSTNTTLSSKTCYYNLCLGVVMIKE